VSELLFKVLDEDGGAWHGGSGVWPLPQNEHKAFFAEIPVEDFQFTPTGQGG